MDKGYYRYSPDIIDDDVAVTEQAGLIELTLIQAWLRNKHKLYLFPDYTYFDGFHYGMKWVRPNGDYGEFWKDNNGEDPDGWDTIEEALLNGIEQALQLIK